jgi:tyrosine-protein kinase Etk/Wzc
VALPTVERELQLRQADVDVANTTYGTVARELKDAELKSDTLPDARLISPASVPELPISPNRPIIALASLTTGFLAGVALAFFLEYMNRKARGINDVENFVGVKVIGTIPVAPQRASATRELQHF